MDASNAAKIIKRVVVSHPSGEKFRLIARAEPGGVRILAEDVPGSLDPALRTILDSRTSGTIADADIQVQWRTLLEALGSRGWTANEELHFTFEFSENDDLVVSRLTSPDQPSQQLADLHKSLHGRLAAVFSDASHRFATEILGLTRQGQHAAAFAALQKAEEEGTFLGGPTREMVDAICAIDHTALARADAFALWGRRVNEKSRGRFYDGMDEDLRIMEQEFADELAPLEGWANVHLLIQAQEAEHTNQPELAHARYRELAGRTPLEAKVRAHANWGMFRLSEPNDANAVRYAELAGDAFLEEGDSIQAVHCYASGADLSELLDRPKALDLLNKALAVLDRQSTRSDEYRARLLYTRASIQAEWRNFPEAFADVTTSIAIRRSLTGVEDGLMAGLQLAKRIAEAMGSAIDVVRLDAEIEALRPRVGSSTRLRHRLATGMAQGIEVQRSLHEEVLKQDDPRLTAESLLALGVAAITTSLSDALKSLEAGLAIVERSAQLRRDLELRALLEDAIGQAFLTHADEARAITWFSRAITHDPRDENARNKLVALLIKHKRHGELVPIMEAQLKVYGELPGLLCFYGQALLGAGRPQAAILALLRAREVCTDPKKTAVIDEWLGKARLQPPELDASRNPAQATRAMTHDEFGAILDSFAGHIKTEHRMTFWRTKDKKKKFVASPEQHGKVLLRTFLRAKLGDDVTILEELDVGAGILDLWVEIPGGMRVVIELKMCGLTYNAGYAAKGIAQLAHYMENKKSHMGHLVIFDARRRDFGKGLEPQVKVGASLIAISFIDIRPDVVAEAKRSAGARKRSAPRKR